MNGLLHRHYLLVRLALWMYGSCNSRVSARSVCTAFTRTMFNGHVISSVRKNYRATYSLNIINARVLTYSAPLAPSPIRVAHLHHALPIWRCRHWPNHSQLTRLHYVKSPQFYHPHWLILLSAAI